MLNKHNLNVVQFAGKEESRCTMTGILVTPEATVATNGHYLMWCGKDDRDAKDYPAIPGFNGASEQFKPFILRREATVAIAKVTPSKERIPILNHVAVSEDGTQMAVTDLENPQVFPVRPLEGRFPQWEVVMPKWEDAKFRISLDASYLAAIAKAFAGFVGDHKHHKVTLSFYAGKDSGIDQNYVRFDGTQDGQGMTAVLAPMGDISDQVGTYGYAERQATRSAAETESVAASI
jgi:hypothetical protein